MTEREKELLLCWLANEDIRLDEECTEIRKRLRFRPVDSVDCMEYALAIQRLDDFREFTRMVLRLMNLDHR